MHFFKSPPFKINDILLGYLPHIWYCTGTLRTFSELSCYEWKILTSVRYTINSNDFIWMSWLLISTWKNVGLIQTSIMFAKKIEWSWLGSFIKFFCNVLKAWIYICTHKVFIKIPYQTFSCLTKSAAALVTTFHL